VRRQLSKVTQSRKPWQHQATQRGEHHRSHRQQRARITAERTCATQALKEARTRLRQIESQGQALVALPKVDGVVVAWHLFFVARIGFRAVCRVLRLRSWALGIKQAPCPQTIINGVRRLASVRIASARRRRGLPLSPAPFTHGLMGMIAISIGLGTGKILAVLAFEAHHHHLAPGALSLAHGHGLGVCVADAWTGDTIATVLGRLSAVMGRPVAYLQDGGGALPKAVAVLGDQGLSSPCIDDIAHAVAGMRQRFSQEPPACETFVSACGRVSGTLKHTILACLAPPKVRTKARCMHGHRWCTWAAQVLKLSPAGGAKTGST